MLLQRGDGSAFSKDGDFSRNYKTNDQKVIFGAQKDLLLHKLPQKSIFWSLVLQFPLQIKLVERMLNAQNLRKC